MGFIVKRMIIIFVNLTILIPNIFKNNYLTSLCFSLNIPPIFFYKAILNPRRLHSRK